MLDNTIFDRICTCYLLQTLASKIRWVFRFNFACKITFRESPCSSLMAVPSSSETTTTLSDVLRSSLREKLGEEPTPKHITIDSPIPLSGDLAQVLPT